MSRYSIETVFKGVDRMSAPISRMQRRVGKFTRSMERGIFKANRAVNKLGRSMKTAGVAMGAGMIAAGAGMLNVINTGATLQQSLTNTATKLDGLVVNGKIVQSEYAKIEAAALKMGKTTEFTASESADALFFFAKAGFSAEQAIAGLPDAVNFATANVELELDRAADIATDVLEIFGMLDKDPDKLAKNMKRVTDVMTKAAKGANISVEQLFETFKNGAPDAIAAGADLETVATIAAKLSSVAKGEKAGIALRNISLAISASTGEKGKLIERVLNVKTFDRDKNEFKDMIQVFLEMEKSMAKLNKRQQQVVGKGIFDVRYANKAAILMQQAKKGMDGFRDSLKDATGTAETAAAIMRGTVLGKWKAFGSAVEGVKQRLFNLEKGPLADMIDGWTEWVRVNEDLIITGVGEFLTSLKEGLRFIVKYREPILKTIAVLAALALAVKVVGAAVAAVTLIMSLNPIGALAIGLTVAAVLIVTHWSEVKAFFLDFWADITARWQAAQDFLSDSMATAIITVQKFIDDFFSSIETRQAQWADSIAAVLVTVEQFFRDVFSSISKQWDAWVDSLVSGLTGALDAIPQKMSSLTSAVSGFFGMGGDEDSAATPQGASASVVSPQDRIIKNIEESRQVSESRLTIEDRTGTAVLESGKATGGQFNLLQTGAY